MDRSRTPPPGFARSQKSDRPWQLRVRIANLLSECLDCKIFCSRSLSLNGMVCGCSINVQGLITNLGEDLTDENNFGLGSGHSKVYFLSSGQSIATSGLSSCSSPGVGNARMQAGDRDASDPFSLAQAETCFRSSCQRFAGCQGNRYPQPSLLG